MKNLKLVSTLGKVKVDFSWSHKEVYKVELKPGDDIQAGDLVTSKQGSKVPVGRVESVNAKEGYFLVIAHFKVQKIEMVGRSIERVS